MARAALVFVSVVVLAWLAAMERDARLESGSLALAGGGKVSRATTDLRRARFLNPDSQPDILLSLIYLGQGDRRRATAVLERVIRREPQNISAWGNLLLVSRRYDAHTVHRAKAALWRLDPVGARRAGGL